MLHTGSVAPMSTAAFHQRPAKPRSPSASSSSAVTVKPTGTGTGTGLGTGPTAETRHDSSVHAHTPASHSSHPSHAPHPSHSSHPSTTPSEDSLLAVKIPTSTFSRSASPNAGTLPSQINDGVGNLNRWSQSTASSAGPFDSPERSRANSGPLSASIWNRRNLHGSQPASPQREELSPRTVRKAPEASPRKTSDQHRRNAPSFDKPLPPAIPPLTALHIPFDSVASPNESDFLLTANSFTPSSAGLLTPLSYSGFDYFGSGATSGGPAPKRDGSSATRHTQQAPSEGQSQRQYSHQHHPSSSIEGVSPGASSQRRPKNRDRRDKDKKTMLSKALEKANTAVLLDNAMNYEGALEAYQDACRLLESVMERSTGPDDKRKLDAIRETYLIRIDELVQLQPPPKAATEQKSLPPRPMSNDSLLFSPSLQVDEPTDRDSAVIETATMTRIVNAPTRKSNMPRNSFLTDAIREVEGTTSGGFLGPLWENAKSPNRESTFSDRTARPGETEQTFLPRPLSPRPAPSINSQKDAEDSSETAAAPSSDSTSEHAAPDHLDPVSWLDTIEESGSDSSSIRSHPDDHAEAAYGEPDFDSAFDAAIEAAFDEDGYMPDEDALADTGTRRPESNALDLAIAPPPEGYSFPTDTESDTDLDAEEERMLDDIGDYIDHGFDFDMQSKSALPRQSDSSVFSRDTWQSSMVSHRTTAGTSISTVAKGAISESHAEDSQAESPPPALSPEYSLGHASARPLSVISEGARSVQDRRSTGPNFKNLKIETARKSLEQWNRSHGIPAGDVTLNENEEETVEGEEAVSNRPISEVPSLRRFEKSTISPQIVHSSANSDVNLGSSMDGTMALDTGDSIHSRRSPRPRLFRKNKSSMSLRDHSMLISEEPNEPLPTTPLSASYAPSLAIYDGGLPTSRRPHIVPSGGSYVALRDGSISTNTLFDTSLSTADQPLSPQSHESMFPMPLEPCPESALLRPFWLMRCIASTIVHPRGGYLSTRLFVPREVWQTRGVKLKNVEDKIANCDLLTAALGKLSSVDSYDVEAILEELQNFEEQMERVQGTLIKKLGSEVGIQSIGAFFKDATSAVDSSTAVTSESGRDAPKTNSGKSYLSSWRKLRSKNSGVGGSFATGVRAEKEGATMPTVPMTSFVSVEKRSAYKREQQHDMTFEGPWKEYMSSLARVCEAAQVLDQVARQVDDPGLKHSSPTHIGLELSTRHAAEFFGFYICRFALADIGVLLDKFVKRSSEMVQL